MYIVLLVYFAMLTHLIKIIIYSQKSCQCLEQILENIPELMQADIINVQTMCIFYIKIHFLTKQYMRNRSSYAVFYFLSIVIIELRISLVCKLRLGHSGTIITFDVEKRDQGIRMSEIHPSLTLKMAIQRVGSVMFLVLSTVQQIVA